MGCFNILCIIVVIFYTISELVTLIMVVAFLSQDRHQIINEVLHFKFAYSTFDLILFSILRFSIIIGAFFGLLCNGIGAIVKLRKLRTMSVYYGCVQAVYVVAKILVFTEDNDHTSRRFWVIVGITLGSCVTFHGCCRVLAKYTSPISRLVEINVNSNYEYETKEENIDKEKKSDGLIHGKMNENDQLEADKLTRNQILSELLKIAKPDCHFIIAAASFLIICSVSQSIIPYYTGLIVNNIVVERDKEKFRDSLLLFIMVSLVALLSAGLRAGCFRYVLGRYKLRLQYTLFKNLMQMEIGFFDSRKTGELSSRLTTDCTKVADGLGLNLNIFLRCTVRMVSVIFFMFKLSWKLSIVAIVALPVVSIISDYFGVQYLNLSAKVQNTLAYANSSAEEAISNIKTVRTFAAETNETERYFNLLESTRLIMRKQSAVSACYRWSVEITNFIMTLLILYYGGHLVLSHHLSGGNLFSFILYSFQLTASIQDVGYVYTGLMEVLGASKNIFLYINRRALVHTDGTMLPYTNFNGYIEFKNVSFSYPSRDDVPVLNNLSFTAEKGEVIALVGPSGGGKSSVINLLQHFYEPTQGEVLIDGVSVREYNHHFLHEKMSLVQQEPILFARTISENIKYGLQCEASFEEVEYSAELANAHSFILSMPDKYDTQTGEKGVQLSGGQKQRVAIARALIRNPRILLLDEATSALDTESEHLVQQAINRNLSGRTVIIIAHRLSTIEKADKILVLEGGKIVEAGGHSELIEQRGAYAALVEKQLLSVDDVKSSVSKETGKVIRKHSFGCISSSSSKSVTSISST